MSYIGNQPVLQTTQFRDEFFPTSNQSAFTTGGFHPSSVNVTRNGVLLSESDYTKGSDNVTITLVNAAVSGDVIVIYGNRSLAQGVSVSESRVEYTWQSGDTAVQLNADVIPAYTDVFLNGVKLAAADYSINASTKQVSFTSAPAVGDVIAVVHKNEASALVALPLKDSSGAEILSESGGAVTLTADEANVGVNENDYINVRGGNGTARVEAVGSNTDVNLSLATKGSGTFYFWSGGYGGTERMRIDSSGRVIVGNNGSGTWDNSISHQFRNENSGQWAFNVNTSSSGTGNVFLISSGRNTSTDNLIQVENNHTSLGGSSIALRFKVDGSGNVYATNTSIQSASDIRLKENITNSTDGLDVVLGLRPVRFDWKADQSYNSGTNQLGFIAQEVEGVFPEAVGIAPLPSTFEGEDPEYKTVAPAALIPVLVKAIQEQHALIESQQSQIDALTARIEALEATP